MDNLNSYRIRAVKAILQKLDSFDSDLQTWDYKLDDVAREVFNLPARPEGSKPYLGWLKLGSNYQKNCVPSTQNISQVGIDLIKKWEGFRSKAYLCPANVWTIGYGHTKNAYKGQCISKAEAEQLLKKDLEYFERNVAKLVTVELTQGQYDALVSFTYNVGVGALAKSTLLGLVNQGKFGAAADEFGRWVYANKKKLPGLVKRREEERKLFLS